MADEELTYDEQAASELTPGTSLRARGCGWIGCLLLIGLVVAVVAGVYFAGRALEPIADRFLWAPSDVVREYLAAYEARDTDRARHFLCSDTASQGVLDPGAAVGAPSTSTSAFVDDTFPYPRANGQVAIYYAVNVPGFANPKRAQALLEREDVGWRICAFTK
jgi:hypothetical protein